MARWRVPALNRLKARFFGAGCMIRIGAEGEGLDTLRVPVCR